LFYPSTFTLKFARDAFSDFLFSLVLLVFIYSHFGHPSALLHGGFSILIVFVKLFPALFLSGFSCRRGCFESPPPPPPPDLALCFPYSEGQHGTFFSMNTPSDLENISPWCRILPPDGGSGVTNRLPGLVVFSPIASALISDRRLVAFIIPRALVLSIPSSANPPTTGNCTALIGPLLIYVEFVSSLKLFPFWFRLRREVFRSTNFS